VIPLQWKHDWDRLVTYVFFMGYGFYSIFFPIISVERSVTHWVEVLLGVEFIFAGGTMIYGLCRGKLTVWTMGMSVAFIGLSTITLVVAITGGFRVFAYALLFGAFAAQSLYGIRRERARRTEKEIRRQLEAILASVSPERTEP
jgi:hypothetical protein